MVKKNFMGKGINLSSLEYEFGSIKEGKRVGRGHGSGNGETSGKGNNGNKQRSGFKRKWGFQGGQTPLYRTLPKIGKNHVLKEKKRAVTLDMLMIFNGEKKCILKEDLVCSKIIDAEDHYKIICGKRNEKMWNFKIYADSFSNKAKDLIEKSGGECCINENFFKKK